MGKTFDDFSLEEALQFEKGKTPKGWVMFWMSLEYLKNPDDPGLLGWMRRIYKAREATRNELFGVMEQGTIKRDTPIGNTIAENINFFDNLADMVAAKKITEQDALKVVAARTLIELKRIYKNPKEMIEKEEHFFDNAQLIPPEKRKILEQVRKMSFREANTLIETAPIVEKLKNVLLSDTEQPDRAATINALQKSATEKQAITYRQELEYNAPDTQSAPGAESTQTLALQTKGYTLRELEEMAVSGDENAIQKIQELGRLIQNAIKPMLDERDELLADPYGQIVFTRLKKQMESADPLLRLSAGQHSLNDIWDIAKAYSEEASKEPDSTDEGQALTIKPEKPPKQQGRYRLTKDEINWRKKIAKKAERLMKESGNKKTWQQIADELDIPERTLRDWRHNPIYQ